MIDEENVIETVVVPSAPRTVPNEQLYVYLPIASTEKPGVSLYNASHFVVENGVVSVREDVFVLQSQLESFISMINELSAAVSDAKADIVELQNTDTTIFENLLLHSNTLSEHTTELQHHQTTLSAHEESIEIHTQQLSAHDATLSEHTAKLSTHDAAIASNAASIDEHSTQILTNTQNIASTTAKLETLESATNDNIKQLNTKIDNTVSRLDTDIGNANSEIETLQDIVKDVQFAVAFDNYAAMITAFNSLALTDNRLRVGQNIYIATQNVPDVWILEISANAESYEYTTDDAVVEALRTQNKVKVGHIVLSALESKLSLEGYAKLTDLASYAKSTDLELYAKSADLQNYASSTALNATNVLVQDLQSKVAELMYVPIAISTFSATAAATESGSTTVYKGDVVTEVTLKWTLSKDPNELSLDGTALDVTLRELNIDNLSISNGTTKRWNLIATDEKGSVDKDSNSITFYDAVWYGVSATSESYDESFIKSLSIKTASNGRPSISDITGETGKYVFYCIPTARGSCTFTDNDTGLAFAMELIASSVAYSNKVGNNDAYTTTYNIYKSINDIAGKINITVGQGGI